MHASTLEPPPWSRHRRRVATHVGAWPECLGPSLAMPLAPASMVRSAATPVPLGSHPSSGNQLEPIRSLSLCYQLLTPRRVGRATVRHLWCSEAEPRLRGGWPMPRHPLSSSMTTVAPAVVRARPPLLLMLAMGLHLHVPPPGLDLAPTSMAKHVLAMCIANVTVVATLTGDLPVTALPPRTLPWRR